MSAGANTKSFLKYSLMPGLFPRFNILFGTGFSYFAYLMAQIYNIPGLLPDTHPYLNTANIGRFGVRHVVAAAAGNLKFKRENTDQIALFFVMLIGLGLMCFQLIALALALISPDAFAGPLNTYFGVNPASDRHQDIAFVLMDRVFGVPGIFESCVMVENQPCYRLGPDNEYDTSNPMNVPVAPWPFHLALHQLFRFYNMGLLVIAMFVILYYVIVVTAETAQTGTPFGKRFNSVWAPIRLVVAIGLLVPLSSGLSSAQYIVLYAAKLGSNMATNGWIVFNQQIAQAQADLLGSGSNVGTPNAPDIRELVTFVTLAKACQKIEDTYMLGLGANAILISDNGDSQDCTRQSGKRPIKPYLISSPRNTPNYADYLGSSYGQALDFYSNGDILVRFGYRNKCDYPNRSGYVNGVCGDLTFPVKAITESGAVTVQDGYYKMVKEMWGDDDIKEIAEHYVNVFHTMNTNGGGAPASQPDLEQLNSVIVRYLGGTTGNEAKNNIRAIIGEGVEAASNPANWDIPAQLLERGWGGAGIWYNRIAQINGALVGASRALPDPAHYPLVMEQIALLNRQTQEQVTIANLYSPAEYAGGENRRAGDINAGRAYYRLHQFLTKDMEMLGDRVEPITGNPLMDAINFLLGTEGLFNLTKEENKDVHPLAQLAALGKGLVESAVFMLGAGTLGGIICAAGSDMGCSGMGLAYGIAGLGLTVGFVLFYVIPFLPFVYFFFAVGGWVKGIFEAMVGAPLWALGHLRIDGNGLPGEGAMNGYYLIFEVFIRPLLILFGFLAGILIFGAMASVLNEIWSTVVENVSGNSAEDTVAREGLDYYLDIARGAVDRLFFTILYAIIMYMMALSSFKLIDMIPNQILRWMGSSASSFGDTNQDVAGNLTQYAAIGGGMVFQQGLGGIQGGFQGARASGQASERLAEQQQLNARLARIEGGVNPGG